MHNTQHGDGCVVYSVDESMVLQFTLYGGLFAELSRRQDGLSMRPGKDLTLVPCT